MSIGIKFPLTDENELKQVFDLSNVNEEAIKSNLILFLVTKKGQRYMRPKFGCDLEQFIFQQNDNTQKTIIEDYLRKEVEQEFTNITINSVETNNMVEGNLYLLILTIHFTYTNGAFTYNDLIVLDLPIPT